MEGRVKVLFFPNGNTAVFDDKGHQIPDFVLVGCGNPSRLSLGTHEPSHVTLATERFRCDRGTWCEPTDSLGGVFRSLEMAKTLAASRRVHAHLPIPLAPALAVRAD